MDFVKEAIAQNSHWETGEIEFPRLSGPMVERPAFQQVEKSAGKKFVTVLRGLRRTGKSFLAKRLAQKLAEKKPANVAWFEFDRAMNATPDDLDSLIKFFQAKGAKTIILDEIPLVPQWQDVVKRHYDRTDLKFIATGSSSIELDKRTSESLAGRFETINIRPYSFHEWLAANGKKPAKTELETARKSEEMEAECEEFLKRGGLPEIAAEKDEQARKKYVDESLLDPLFYKDLPAVFPSANPDLLRKTLELLAATAGGTYQAQNIAEALGSSHTTAATQVEILERALLVWTSYNKTPSIAKQKRTAKKIVFADNGILRALRPETPISNLAENAAAAFFESKTFWKNPEGREIDVLLPERKIAVEVKYAEHITSADEKNVGYFLEKNSGWKGVLATKNDEDNSNIKRIPLWKILLGEPFAQTTSEEK